MRTARITMLAIPILAGLAFAQNQPQSAPQTAAKQQPAEMKTSTYRGTLVDVGCASGAQTSAPAAEQGNAANRAAGETSCPVTANTSQFGLKMKDGQVARFDLVGNQRAQEEIKNNKRWSKAMSAAKPMNVKVLGALQGDKLIVSSIK